jgi:hypothetical protein
MQVPCLDLVVDPALSPTLVGFKNLGATESRYSICYI